MFGEYMLYVWRVYVVCLASICCMFDEYMLYGGWLTLCTLLNLFSLVKNKKVVVHYPMHFSRNRHTNYTDKKKI